MDPVWIILKNKLACKEYFELLNIHVTSSTREPLWMKKSKMLLTLCIPGKVVSIFNGKIYNFGGREFPKLMPISSPFLQKVKLKINQKNLLRFLHTASVTRWPDIFSIFCYLHQGQFLHKSIKIAKVSSKFH